MASTQMDVDEQESLTQLASDQVKPMRSPILSSLETGREIKYLTNTRRISGAAEQSVSHLAGSGEAYLPSKYKIHGEVAVAKRSKRARRPVTAPRARVDTQTQEQALRKTPSQMDVRLFSERKCSSRQIKSYLKKEFSSNKLLSVQDYKQMTQQVVQLRKLENAYLQQDLAPKPAFHPHLRKRSLTSVHPQQTQNPCIGKTEN